MSNSGTYKTHAPNAVTKSGGGAFTAPTQAAKPGKSEAKTVPERGAAMPAQSSRPKEIGGPKGPEPTRFGDWERDGRCVDF